MDQLIDVLRLETQEIIKLFLFPLQHRGKGRFSWDPPYLREDLFQDIFHPLDQFGPRSDELVSSCRGF